MRALLSSAAAHVHRPTPRLEAGAAPWTIYDAPARRDSARDPGYGKPRVAAFLRHSAIRHAGVGRYTGVGRLTATRNATAGRHVVGRRRGPKLAAAAGIDAAAGGTDAAARDSVAERVAAERDFAVGLIVGVWRAPALGFHAAIARRVTACGLPTRRVHAAAWRIPTARRVHTAPARAPAASAAQLARPGPCDP